MKKEGESYQYLSFLFFVGTKLYVKTTSLKSVIKTKSVGKETLPEKTPKRCKRYSLGNYRFKHFCVYKLGNNFAVQDQCEVKEEI